MKKKLAAGLLVLVLAFLYYYVTLPAINIHESGFWFFLAALVAVMLLLYAVRKRIRSMYELKSNKVLKGGVFVILGIGVVYAVGALLSSPIVNANKYQKLVQPEERNFTEDIEEISYDQIPLLDKESASLLGDRKMGSMVDLVSQFEVSDLYSQINYKGQPYRVTPLEYASAIKWITNQKEGIPAYILIDMATQNTELVQLEEGIRYSESEYFNRNIYRHIRFKYPTYMFDQLSFEIDDEGTPYWICPVKKFNIGLFGGQTIGRVVLCNAQTGETQDYKIEDCPQWVDRAYPADLLTQLYNYHGMLKNGFFNSVLGQKGCLQTTDGFNYLALEDDVWVYTGVTSVSGDKSNLGFVLMNQRTMETRYYACDGAQERSAMASAEGQVQNLKYVAAFPLLLNISDQPTYFMALKDGAGLVKKYAMVNVQKYQTVAIGDSVAECEKNYEKLLSENGIASDGSSTGEKNTVTGVIKRMAQAVVEGNSHFYITLEPEAQKITGPDEENIQDGQTLIFDASITSFPEIIGFDEGDTLTMEFKLGQPVCKVVTLEGQEAADAEEDPQPEEEQPADTEE
nr:CvpA family protein [uncultured Blautia sp.]